MSRQNQVIGRTSGCKGHGAVLSPKQSCSRLVQGQGGRGWVLASWPTFEPSRPNLASRGTALITMELAALILIVAAGKIFLISCYFKQIDQPF